MKKEYKKSEKKKGERKKAHQIGIKFAYQVRVLYFKALGSVG